MNRSFLYTFLLVTVLFFGVYFNVHAAPQTIGYEGFITNTSGTAQTGTYDMRLRIYDTSTGGTLLYDETHTGVSVSNGYFGLSIGNGTVNGGTVTSLNQLSFNEQYFLSLEVTTLVTGEMSPRTPINAVPYAYTAYGLLTSSTDPLSPIKGKMYFNTTDNLAYIYNGTIWNSIASGSGLTSLNSQTGISQSFATTTTGTDFSISSSGNVHSFNIPNSSAVNRGLLTALDWSTFNSKQAALGYTPLNPASNLSDVASVSTARTNLGLGTLATQSGTFSGTSSGTNTGDQTLSSLGAAASGANTDITSLLLNQTGLVIKGGDANALTIKPNETLTAGRTLNIVTGNTTRTLTFTADASIGGTSSGVNTGDQTTISGNAGTATALQIARTINGVSFDGTANITVPAAAGTLTGVTLASGITASSLTSLGTLADLTVTNPITGSVTGNAGTVTNGVYATDTGSVTSAMILNSTILAADISSGAITALKLQSAAADLGAADVTVNFGNTNGSFNTNITTDGSITAGSFVGNVTGSSGSTTGNAVTATALAANGANCSAGLAPLGIDASGAVESCTDFEEDLSNSAGLLAALSDETGTGLAVFGTAPTFASTMTIGTVGGTTGAINLKGTTSGTVTLTTAAAAGTYTLTLPTDDGTSSQFLQTDGSGVLTWVSIPGGGDALTTSPLSQFAATTSAQLAGVISNETGSGALVFADSPVFTTPNIGSATGSITGNAGTVTIADAGGDTTTFVALGTSATGSLTPVTDSGLTYNATTDALTAATFVGALTGNASTAAALQTARTIGGVSFDGTTNITVASATGAFTVSGALAANGGITFDSSTDTLGAFTLGGTLDASTQIITNIGNTGTDFVASTGALTLAGVLTANGGISIDGNALTGTTGIIDYTNFDVDASGNTDIGGTITAGSSNTAVTLSTGLIDADALTLTAAADGGTGTSSGSGLIARSDGIGLLQGCADTQVLKWVESTDTWDCGSSQYSKFISITAVNKVALTGQTADVAGTDIDVTADTSATATHVLARARLEMTTIAVDSPWTGHLMPNGTAVADSNVVVGITTGDSAIQHESAGEAIIALDADQIFDYGLDEITGSATVAFNVYILGYWEPVTTGADLAEYYYTNDESIQPGDIVSLDPSSPGEIKKSEGKHDENVLGVVSTNPGMVLGDILTPGSGVQKLTEEEAKKFIDQRPMPVALVGRVPVNVSIENGPIVAGDYLTSSSTPGVAMKAMKSGKVIGQALFGHDKEEVGAVMMFIKNFDFGNNALLLGDISKTDGLTTLVSDIQAEAVRDPVAIIAQKITDGAQFLTNFVSARVSAIRGYFDEVFVNKSHQKTLCIGDVNDEGETCITKTKLDQLFENQNTDNLILTPDSNPASTPIPDSPAPNETPTPDLTPEPIPEPAPDSTSIPDLAPAPDSNSTPDSDITPAPEPDSPAPNETPTPDLTPDSTAPFDLIN